MNIIIELRVYTILSIYYAISCNPFLMLNIESLKKKKPDTFASGL